MIILILLLGIIFGSFINALGWRLHQQSITKRPGRTSQNDARQVNLSVLTGRSICPKCHHQLAAKDLIPIISWLMLSGKCRYCRKPISFEYPLVELLTGILFVLSYLYWPLGFAGVGLFEFIIWLIFLVGFIALAIYDIKWFILPDKIVYSLMAVAIIELIAICILRGSISYLFGAIWGVLILGGLYYGIFQASGGKWIGGGDVKLGALLGIIVGGPSMSVMVLFMSSILGLIVTLPFLMVKRAKLDSLVPFGPFLMAATFITVMFGSVILEHFKRFYL